MTHMLSAARRCRRDFGRDRTARGFTLIEVIVVMVVIAVLAAIVVPAVFKARSTAGRIRTGADLAVIGMALEEFKKDHGGQYPQVPRNPPNSGFAVLAQALVGTYGDGVLPPPAAPGTPDLNDPPAWDGSKEYLPGDCIGGGTGERVCLEQHVGQSASNERYWAAFDANDGLDGVGHAVSGRKYPPYLQSERFRVRGSALVDANDKPMLYFPKLANLNVKVTGAHISLGGASMYDANHNRQFFARPAAQADAAHHNKLSRMRAVMGDINGDGDFSDTNESEPKTTGDFILWAAGPDGFYGPVTQDANRELGPPYSSPLRPDEVSKCDDVTNFER